MTVEETTAAELPDRAVALLRDHRLALMSAQQSDSGFTVAYLFTAPGRVVELRLPVPGDRPAIPSLAELSFPAGRFEREIRDLYGITPTDHPQPRRLVRHHHWPRDWFPMLDGAGPPPAFGDPEGPYPFLKVEGPGVYEIPVGPVHAGLIEPGHFRFSVVGETIVKLKARLWFVHKGIEKLFEGRTGADGLELAERVSGDTTVGHAIAYCRAVEAALGIAVPEPAHRARAVLLELERLYNHVTDLGALCNDVAHGILHSHALQLRERLLRLNDRVTGHRLLRGGVLLGGARLLAVPDPADLADIGAEAAEIAALALSHSVVRDRFSGTAILERTAAADLGTLGYVARASGLTADARADHPWCELPDFAPVVRDTGDVLARFEVRAAEIAASTRIVAALAAELSADTWRGPAPIRTDGVGVGIVEGWRGTVVHRVDLADGRARRVKIVDPSFLNWPALPVALSGAIVPDFPLVNKSFNLSYAGNDL